MGSPGLTASLMALGIFFFGTAMFWCLFSSGGVVVVGWRARGLPFSVAWWGFVFPWGLLAFTALRIGTLIDVEAFKIVGCIFSVTTAAMWSVCTWRTHTRFWTGRAFIHET